MTNLFKPKVELVQPNLSSAGFNAGGLTGTAGFNGATVAADPARIGLISDMSQAGTNAADTYQGLADTVKPGFNDLLKARLATINDAARSAIGDLSQNLSARRILGSSFGNDTLTRAQAEFGRLRDTATADNFLKSLEASRQLTADTLNARLQSFTPRLNELNLEASLAASLGSQGSKLLADAAQFNAKNQNASNAAGTASLGSIIGTGLGLARTALTGGMGGLGGLGTSIGSYFPSSTGSYGGVSYPIFGTA